MEDPFSSGAWTLYYHPSREKRWTLDSFEKIEIVKNIKEVLSVYKELGEKLKGGMFFWMKGNIPPLWENFQNIRGGSYSIRGIGDNGKNFGNLTSCGCFKTNRIYSDLTRCGIYRHILVRRLRICIIGQCFCC